MSPIPAFLALFVSTPTLHAAERHEVSRRIEDSMQMRTTPEILYGCIITIILCSSYCIRPNLSSPNASKFRVLRRRLNVTFWMVLCPELIIIWALKQWRQAHKFASKYTDRRWTVMHGQFVIMGGFLLFQDDRPVQVLSPQKFTDLLDAACIDFPSITEDEIKRKGRSHPLLSAITLLQTLWFFTQCIARRAQGLDLTQLEMVTLYLISTHALLLLPWCQKPLDARDGIRVELKRMPATALYEWSSVQVGVRRDFSRQHHLLGKQLKVFQNLEFPIKIESTKRSLPSTLQFYLFAPIVFISSVLAQMLVDFGQLFIPEEVNGESISDGLLEVPLFYAPGSPTGSLDTLLLVGKSVMGSCFASAYIWMRFSTFPSLADEMVWIISSVISAGLPMLLILFIISFVGLTLSLTLLPCFSLHTMNSIGRKLSVPVGFTVCVGFLVSIFARIAVLIEAFVCLKTTDPSKRLLVAWTNYIPHFS